MTKAIIVTILTILYTAQSTQAAVGSENYLEALRCHDRFSASMGEQLAAVLCRGVISSNATAVYSCVGDFRSTYSAEAVAMLCQGITYDRTIATGNCMAEMLAEASEYDAARLCQQTSSRTYNIKMQCLGDARDIMGISAAAELCGDI